MYIFKWISEQLNTHRHSNALKRQMEKINESFALCNELMEQQDEEINMIQDALCPCFDDEIAQNNLEDLRHTDLRFFINIKNEEVYEKSRLHRQHVLNELRALLASYPMLEEGEITSETLDTFYLDRVTHHYQVMALVEVYLPETYEQLKIQHDQLRLGEVS